MTDRPRPPDEFDPSQSYQEILSSPLEARSREAAPQDLAARMADELPDDIFDPDPTEAIRQPRPPVTMDSLIAEIKENADKLVRDNAALGDVKILARVLKELRYAFKVFTPYRQHKKVTVFGSARTIRIILAINSRSSSGVAWPRSVGWS